MSGHVWWTSPLDDLTHAIGDSAGPGDGTVDTECGRVLDIVKAGKSPSGSFCDDCLQKVGTKVDDSSRWR
ncbi:hypothetical protein C8D88_11559 [Lentzea atacamensis]|uniref:Uncharacterized protein n=1 Tax=Lentzea atacamensis TaxID=531938 RepID=A0A316I3Q3_9PSEU|nr:hypothetical protein [Lentzea atacamensis]PWK81943.1 hypothetical protein C8D88_11559 [Lentzea atacamensis]